MNWGRFETHVPGKWILAGEHAVLRGATAIAIPRRDVGLSFKFNPSTERYGAALHVEPETASAVIQDLLVAIDDDLKSEEKPFQFPRGELTIESTIPTGAGLGSSAALCVAMARWLADPLGLRETSAVTELATQLEHRFHGRSSGLDVAVVSLNEPIAYVQGRPPRPIGIRKFPRFTFHDTALRTRTSECVIRVEKFREDNPTLALRLDEAMGHASRWAMEGLIRFDSGYPAEGIDLIAKGMTQAQECFYGWELVPGEAKRLIENLKKEGAVAAKVTGAGGGGFVVALWNQSEPNSP